MTCVYNELCQEKLFKPDPEVVLRNVAEQGVRAKAKGSARRRNTEEKSSDEENTEDEEARDQAKTFGMSVGQKRAFEN